MKFFITGISKGLGKSLAEECVLRGHEVRGVARTQPLGLSGAIHYEKCDISNYSEAEEAYKKMIGAGYIPEVAILNASVVKDDYNNGIDLERVRETFDINVLGNLHWVKLFLPHFMERKEGIFLNISSVSSFRAIGRTRTSISYPASKSAIDMVFEGLRIHCSEGKIRFVTVNLGPLGERRRIPLLSSTYERTAKKIIARLEAKKIGNVFSYPALAGFIYKVSRMIPDSMLRKIASR